MWVILSLYNFIVINTSLITLTSTDNFIVLFYFLSMYCITLTYIDTFLEFLVAIVSHNSLEFIILLILYMDKADKCKYLCMMCIMRASKRVNMCMHSQHSKQRWTWTKTCHAYIPWNDYVIEEHPVKWFGNSFLNHRSVQKKWTPERYWMMHACLFILFLLGSDIAIDRRNTQCTVY